MSEKHIDDNFYRVVHKDGSHLNTKVNPDGSKSALQFTDDNNGLNGPVDLIEVDESELIRTEYIQVPQKKQPLRERLINEVVIPVVKDASIQILNYCVEKAELGLKEKAGSVIKEKAGWQNIKIFASVLKDPSTPTKAEQIISEQENSSITKTTEIANTNISDEQDNKEYILSSKEVQQLLEMTKRSALMLAASLNILNNSVIMDDGTDEERIAMIRRSIKQLSSKDITTQINLLLEDKNSVFLDATSIEMLKAFRNGIFIGNGTPIPISRYITNENKDI